MPLNVRDTQLKGTGALPASASSSVSICAIDLQETANDDLVARAEFLLTYPALTTTMLPDTRTCMYDVIHSDNADLSSSTTIYPGIALQTGAGGAGAVAGTVRFRPPVLTKRYIGIKATLGASTTDSSTKSATLECLT